MLQKQTDFQIVEQLCESDLGAACEKARELVASYPADEHAARLLRETVERFAREQPHERRQASAVAPEVREAAEFIAARELEKAEILLREHLEHYRHDPPAMHLMAEIAALCDFPEDADRILRESARIHANSYEAWTSLGMTLHRIACEKDYPDYVPRAVRALDEALRLDPAYEPALAHKANILLQTRGLDLARHSYERLVSLSPQVSMHWLNYGYLLKTLGEFGRGVAAFRTAVALEPMNGTAWYSLANLKIAKFFDDDLEAMQAVLRRPNLPEVTHVELCFTLFKAFDQRKQYEQAARRLIEGNDLQKLEHGEPETNIVGAGLDFARTVLTADFFEHRRGWGEARRDPIFIIGMPRAGSTLVEQILASHPLIEGTEELFVVHQLELELGRDHFGKSPEDLIRALTKAEFDQLGARYIELAKRSRQTDRPLFTDKNPANWRYVGFIHGMLPNAKIIDVRRNPMDCCFANFSQLFGGGATYSYDQRQLGRYYSDYVRIMRHFDEVLPGRVHRLIHDDLVGNLEYEVRRLLDYVEVPFNERCLRFFEADRPVHTPSSEQVRQPINREGFGRWRNYEPWLGDLKEGLSGVMDDWRS